MTCITPRALVLDTIALLNPLSCHPMAAASEPGTPCSPAMRWMSAALTRPAAGAGAAGATAGAAPRGGHGRARREPQRRAGDEVRVRAQAVQRGHLRDRDAIAQGELAQRVARLDDVAARGRCRGAGRAARLGRSARGGDPQPRPGDDDRRGAEAVGARQRGGRKAVGRRDARERLARAHDPAAAAGGGRRRGPERLGGAAARGGYLQPRAGDDEGGGRAGRWRRPAPPSGGR